MAAAGTSQAHCAQSPEQQTNRPPASDFHQQRLAAWQPLITAGSVFPLFLILSVVFVGFGILLLVNSSSVQEVVIDYTGCSDGNASCSERTADADFQQRHGVCSCNVSFTIDQPIVGQVYVYYGLSNFFQNHRKYVKSLDKLQLAGKRSSDLDDSCRPYRRRGDLWVAPCGSVAASIFNDTFVLRHLRKNGNSVVVPWTKEGIAWPTDSGRKFGSVADWSGTTKPDSWPLSESQRTNGTGYSADEELQVWMRVAALPWFRKLHRIVLHERGFADGLPSGNYRLDIGYSFPVAGFGGTKTFVLATVSEMGGGNNGLGAVMLIAGVLHFFISCSFFLLHQYASKSRKKDQFWGMDPKHRLLLERMYSSSTGLDEEDAAAESQQQQQQQQQQRQ